MSGGANQSFLELREQFLAQNILIVTNPQAWLTGANAVAPEATSPDVWDFDLVHDPGSKFVDDQGKAVKTYKVQLMATRKGVTAGVLADPKTGKRTRHVHAYYLRWDNNRHYQTQLGDDADFMFTPTLDGCSFVIGSGPSPMVAHLNYQGGDGRIDQGRIDTEIGNLYPGPGPQTQLKLADYSPNSHAEKLTGKTTELSVVGFRDPVARTWRFFYQKRNRAVVDGRRGPMVQEILADRLVPIV
jgi:hypothetical protein